uniref:RH62702p n=1 Tax=Drosophila melanogaster TaxID=7227 RepID=Q8SXE3_DROME|nr:RH62702p [Drosophila melanogaster]
MWAEWGGGGRDRGRRAEGVARCRGCKQKRIKNLTLCVPKGVDAGWWGRFPLLPSAVDANGIKISCLCIFSPLCHQRKRRAKRWKVAKGAPWYAMK